MDPKVGTDQESEKLWGNIFEYFKGQMNELQNVQSDRTMQSLKNRWGILNRDVGKFAGCYQKIVALNKSGKTEEDRIEDATQLFKDTETINSVSCTSGDF